MFHYIGTVTDRFGNGLSGWQVEIADGLSVVEISGGTVPALSSRAITDPQGNFDFFVADGRYAIRYYDAAGTLRRTDNDVQMIGPTTGGTGLFIQATQPTEAGAYLWLKPGAHARAQLYFEDGV
jgi:hypothetical protein